MENTQIQTQNSKAELEVFGTEQSYNIAQLILSNHKPEVIISAIAKIRRNLTDLTAYISSDIQICVLRKNKPLELIKLVTILIFDVTKRVHSSQKMDDEEIYTCAEDLILDFWQFKFEEFVLCFSNLRKAKIYNRLDQSVIYEAFNSYNEKRDRVIERASQVSKKSQIEIDAEIDQVRYAYRNQQQNPKKSFVNARINEKSHFQQVALKKLQEYNEKLKNGLIQSDLTDNDTN